MVDLNRKSSKQIVESITKSHTYNNKCYRLLPIHFAIGAPSDFSSLRNALFPCLYERTIKGLVMAQDLMHLFIWHKRSHGGSPRDRTWRVVRHLIYSQARCLLRNIDPYRIVGDDLALQSSWRLRAQHFRLLRILSRLNAFPLWRDSIFYHVTPAPYAIAFESGWDGRIRTYECKSQSLVP